jgi:hypothetical protein
MSMHGRLCSLQLQELCGSMRIGELGQLIKKIYNLRVSTINLFIAFFNRYCDNTFFIAFPFMRCIAGLKKSLKSEFWYLQIQ